MKKSVEISVHLIFWGLFTLLVFAICQISMKARPDAPFVPHIPYVVFLEVFMGLIFFYTAFFALPWAKKQNQNKIILAVIFLILLAVFAFPATRVGTWEVMSSLVPHTLLILLGIVFRRFSELQQIER